MNSVQIDSSLAYAVMSDSHLERVVAIEEAVHGHPWTRGNFADSIAAGYDCWVACHGATIVGYGIVATAAAEAHLLDLGVAPEWQRQGIGAELTRFLVRIARDRGAARMFLEVRPSNGAARALYAAHGFREIAIRRGYYPGPNGPEDAIVMEAQL
jgi:[ribosomal protein S18]-alanine N-acetyltransferase